MGRESNISKALTQLEAEACNYRNTCEGYKEELFDSIARRIVEGKCTKRQIRYWAERNTKWRMLNKPIRGDR